MQRFHEQEGGSWWGSPALADDEATATAEKGTPAVAPVTPTSDEHGRKDRIDRIRGRGHRRELETSDVPFDTQPILIGYRSTETTSPEPPAAPEPTTFALMSVGLASWILFNRRRKS